VVVMVIPARDYLRFSIQGQKQGLLDYFARILEAKAMASRTPSLPISMYLLVTESSNRNLPHCKIDKWLKT